MHPCPFCTDDRLSVEQVYHDDEYMHAVECLSCGMRGPARTSESSAIEVWNGLLRAPAQDSSVQALVKALRYYARGSQYVVSYKYRGGELISAEAPITEDAGAKARAALTPFKQALGPLLTDPPEFPIYHDAQGREHEEF